MIRAVGTAAHITAGPIVVCMVGMVQSELGSGM